VIGAGVKLEEDHRHLFLKKNEIKQTALQLNELHCEIINMLCKLKPVQYINLR